MLARKAVGMMYGVRRTVYGDDRTLTTLLLHFISFAYRFVLNGCLIPVGAIWVRSVPNNWVGFF